MLVIISYFEFAKYSHITHTQRAANLGKQATGKIFKRLEISSNIPREGSRKSKETNTNLLAYNLKKPRGLRLAVTWLFSLVCFVLSRALNTQS